VEAPRPAKKAKVRFDLGIMDEAHKTVGDSGKLFSHLLHDANLPIRRRIFMTATERRYAGQSDTVLSMDNPAIYGETFHLLSFKRALEYDQPILSDYKIISIAVSRDEVADLIRKNVFVRPDKGRWNKEIEADMLASLIALRKAMAKHPIRHAVSFHSSIQRAELFKTHNDAFSHAFPRYGSLETYHVSGKTPTGTRARIIGEFAQTQRALITNARCLTEGVDVPGIDCVLFADPRRSAVDIVQAVGRALRPAPGKELGYVIVPILHEADATPDDIYESDSFREILTTLRALAANDDRIIEYFRAASQGRQRTGGGSVEFDMDERLAQRIDLAQFVRQIDLKCWDSLAKLSWRPFEDARAFVRQLNLKNVYEWYAFSRGKMPRKGRCPADIPVCPDKVYANKGWNGWSDWFGTGRFSSKLTEARSFSEARTFARKLKLKNSAEWIAFCKGEMPRMGHKPADIPSSPYLTYADKGWNGMGDWLGTGNVSNSLKKYRQFLKARAFVRRLKLKNEAEWRAFCKGETPHLGRLPVDIPTNPHRTYDDSGWKWIGDWLGTGFVASRLRKYRPFRKARAFVHKLKLKSGAEWDAYCKGEMSHLGRLPEDITIKPERAYTKKGWRGMGDWLGTGSVANRLKQYRTFSEARAFARKLKLKSCTEWNAFCKGKMPRLGRLPTDIPAQPRQTYDDKGWKGYRDWLGPRPPLVEKYRSFHDARAFVRELKLKSCTEWWAFRKLGRLPADIPGSPSQVYAAYGWKNWGDWLGTGTVAPNLMKYRPFGEARTFVRKLKLKTYTEWRAFCKGQMPEFGRLPKDIPRAAEIVYAHKGWRGYGDWLENGRKRRAEAVKHA